MRTFLLLLLFALPAQAAFIDFSMEPRGADAVDIYASGDTPLGFYVFGIGYEPTLLRPVSYTPSDLMDPQFGFATEVALGLLYVESISALDSAALPAEGLLATLQFERLAAGPAVVGFTFTGGGDLSAVPTRGTGTVLHSVPEPVALLLLATGGFALTYTVKRRVSTKSPASSG